MISYKSSMRTFRGISSVGRAPALQAGGHSAVNRSVVGSSPTGGAHRARKFNIYGLSFVLQHALRGQNRPFAEKAGIRLLTEK